MHHSDRKALAQALAQAQAPIAAAPAINDQPAAAALPDVNMELESTIINLPAAAALPGVNVDAGAAGPGQPRPSVANNDAHEELMEADMVDLPAGAGLDDEDLDAALLDLDDPVSI
jgi:hypothetical protein